MQQQSELIKAVFKHGAELSVRFKNSAKGYKSLNEQVNEWPTGTQLNHPAVQSLREQPVSLNQA